MSSRLHGFLAGVRVLDLSRHLPGPLATLLLADMGAEVTKVESPAGDEMRSIGPIGPHGRSLFFDAVNAGKRSVRLDLKTADGVAALRALAATADVLVESFRPGVMARLGLGADVLRAANPGLICIALSGYGQDGPLRDVAGHDANYLALNGILSANGSAAAPSYPHPPMADCAASLFAVSSVLGALIARSRDGRGCEIDLALADVTMPFQLFSLAALGQDGRVPRPEQEFLNGGWACYRPYRLGDGGDVALGAIEPQFWRRFCHAAAHPEWLPRHAEPLPQTALITELGGFFATMSRTECETRFAGVDCCLSVVNDLREAVDSAHVRERQLVRQNPTMGIYEAAYPIYVDGQRPELRTPLAEG